MLSITQSSVILGRIDGRKRAMKVLVAVESRSETRYSDSRLVLRLRDAQANLMAEMSLRGGPISPGRQVLTFEVTVPGTVISGVDGELHGFAGRWVTPVSGLRPFQAPAADATATITAAPKAVERTPPPWERFAVKRTAAPRPIEPEIDPEGPWAKLDAGEVAEAMALFDRHRLDEVGQHRLRALLDSDDAQEIAWGCQISRLVRWVTVSTMRGLLSHADSRVRREAVDSLGRIAGSSAQGDVAPLLNDPDPGVADAAALCMARITGKAPRW